MFEFPKDFKEQLFAGRTQILCVSDATASEQLILAYKKTDKTIFEGYLYFHPGQVTLRFLSFDSVNLKWSTYYEKSLELTDDPAMQELTIKVPKKIRVGLNKIPPVAII